MNCCWCGDDVPAARWALGIRMCMVCGEEQAKQERASWCVVPMLKSNYVMVTDPELLKGLNKYAHTESAPHRALAARKNQTS